MTTATPPTSRPAWPLRADAPLDERIDACHAVLETMRMGNGLYLASPSADYSKVWLRDTFYESLPYVDRPTHHYEQTYWSLLDVLRRHEYKVDAVLRAKPSDGDAYVHARFDPETLREIREPWGNKQNDAVGAVLFGVALGLRHGRRTVRDERDRRVVQKLVAMLGALRYWEDPDNGMWEEAEEVHASSVGACLGGLLALRDAGFAVPAPLVDEGRAALDALLPRESASKPTDLALLSLCWPYRVVSPEQRRRIVADVEERLLRARGAIRYEGDSYYSTLAEEMGRDAPRDAYEGTEAEWTFALPWLSLIHREAGDDAKADELLARTAAAEVGPGALPELYFAGTDTPNPNAPLGWAVAMHAMALEAKRGRAPPRGA